MYMCSFDVYFGSCPALNMGGCVCVCASSSQNVAAYEAILQAAKGSANEKKLAAGFITRCSAVTQHTLLHNLSIVCNVHVVVVVIHVETCRNHDYCSR